MPAPQETGYNGSSSQFHASYLLFLPLFLSQVTETFKLDKKCESSLYYTLFWKWPWNHPHNPIFVPHSSLLKQLGKPNPKEKKVEKKKEGKTGKRSLSRLDSFGPKLWVHPPPDSLASGTFISFAFNNVTSHFHLLIVKRGKKSVACILSSGI